MLPDGKVIKAGVQVRSLVFSDLESVLVPELWDQKIETWTELSPAAAPHSYHSVSILLADGKVPVEGMCLAVHEGDLSCCNRVKDRYDNTISPPYPFTSKAALVSRPDIRPLSEVIAVVGARVTATLQNRHWATLTHSCEWSAQ